MLQLCPRSSAPPVRPSSFFSPPSVAPSTRREGLGADDKMLKLSPLQRYFLAFFAPSLEDRWKPLEPFHSSNIALVFQMFVYSRFSRWLVRPSTNERFLLIQADESLTVGLSSSLSFLRSISLEKKGKSSGVVNSFWWSERGPRFLRSPLGRDKLLRTTKTKRFWVSRVGHAPATRTRWYTISRPSWYLPKSLDTSVARIIKDTTPPTPNRTHSLGSLRDPTTRRNREGVEKAVN